MTAALDLGAFDAWAYAMRDRLDATWAPFACGGRECDPMLCPPDCRGIGDGLQRCCPNENARRFRAELAWREGLGPHPDAHEADARRDDRPVAAGIPTDIAAVLSGPPMHASDAWTAVQRWLRDESRRWLVLSGPRGVGCSVAAGWAMRRAGGRWVAGTVLRLSAISDVRAWAAEPGVLVLDEPYDAPLSPIVRDRLRVVLEARSDGRRTLLTTHLDESSLRAAVALRLEGHAPAPPDEATWERLARLAGRVVEVGINRQQELPDVP